MKLAALRLRTLAALGLPALVAPLEACLSAEAASPPARAAQARPRPPTPPAGTARTPQPPRPAREGFEWACGEQWGCRYERGNAGARAAAAPYERCLRSLTAADRGGEPMPSSVQNVPSGTVAQLSVEQTATQRREGNYTLCCYEWRGCVERELRPEVMIGRALRTELEGPALRADAVARGDWCASLEVAGQSLGPSERALVARAWSDAAALEHASVASFARLSLELLALGAPPSLLEQCHRAALDELEHARLSYGVATALGAEPTGPGALSAALAPMFAASPAALLEAAWRDGCVGETLAALVAHEAGEGADDNTLATMLTRIARDEERHAELAWLVVGWAARCDGAARAQLEALLDELAAPQGDAEHEDECGASSVLSRWGHPSAHRVRALRERVLREVVVPCTRALLASC